jgi:hypothetical protein
MKSAQRYERPFHATMSNRWFTLAVVLFWLASMGWLVSEKVVPALRVGERPGAAPGAAPARQPVAWALYLNERQLGWASTDSTERPDRVVELRNRVHLDRFPLKEIAPWLAKLLDPRDGDDQMAYDTDSRIELADGRLLGFRTSISIGELKDAILVHGTAEGKQLALTVRSGDFSYDTTANLPADAVVGDSLSPRARLVGLRLGQTWTEPVYSPLNPPNSPLQILHARVDRYEPVPWNDRIVRAAVVVYQDDSGSDSRSSRSARAQAWVNAAGDVLKQEVSMLGVKLLFVRLPPGQAVEGLEAP